MDSLDIKDSLAVDDDRLFPNRVLAARRNRLRTVITLVLILTSVDINSVF